MRAELNFTAYKNVLQGRKFIRVLGKVRRLVGFIVEVEGLKLSIGEICEIFLNSDGSSCIRAEVVGFREDSMLLMPLGELENIGPGCLVRPVGKKMEVPVGKGLLGRILDGLGNPIDGRELDVSGRYPLKKEAPDPLKRRLIREVLPTGVRAIDALLTCGRGQRMGIFAGSGVGKSTLLGMIARHSKAEVNVIALIGERGREVREFLEKDLKSDGLQKSVVVVATSDQPALVRIKAVFTATAVAEYFRDQGKNVVLMMDSITRFAMAQRELGLAVGEPPTTKGYPPSVFALLPKFLERAGQAEKGSITGFYTVLVDADDMNEPIADAARSILDGHIVLSRDLASRNHYPAVDVLASVSRVMPDITTEQHKGLADRLKNLLASYFRSEDLINIGAYEKGSNPRVDEAIEHYGRIENFLKQGPEDYVEFEDAIRSLEKAVS